ncbi:MAG: DUF3783 domain-containing protein [Spirochaetota bacterium]
MNKSLCLICGISPEKISKGLQRAEKHLPANAPKMEAYVEYMRNDMLESPINRIVEQFWKDPTPLESGLSAVPEDALQRRGRVVIIRSFLKDHVFAIMRGIKSASSRPQDIIFAVVTETALTWTLDQYLEHLKAEHEHFKRRSAEDDPHMKKY